jgi:monofunctional biosynthetic peptidoglycan transglycosylase
MRWPRRGDIVRAKAGIWIAIVRRSVSRLISIVYRLLKRLFVIALLIVAAYVAWEWITFPNVAALNDHWPKTTAFMELRKRELRAAGKDDTLLYQPVPYARISPYLRRAVLVAEDDTFYEHKAVDVAALKEAIQKDWQRKKITRGGSTITQQLAKNLYLSPSRNPLRKLKEYLIARSLENHLSKKRILELYMNVVEMGERVYGAQAAAQTYFHTDASSITPSQSALLAGSLPNPRLMNPESPNKRLRSRQRMILSRMRRWGYLFEQEVLTEKKTPVDTTPLQQTPATDTATPAPTETTPPAETTTTQ